MEVSGGRRFYMLSDFQGFTVTNVRISVNLFLKHGRTSMRMFNTEKGSHFYRITWVLRGSHSLYSELFML